MSTKTTNLGLTKPAADENVNRTVINTNYDVIDTAVAAKVNKTDIVNSLDSTVTNVPLSAYQGKVLNDKVSVFYPDHEIVSDCDTAIKDGFYGITSASAGRPVDRAVLQVIRRSDTNVVQMAYSTQSQEIFTRRTQSGTFVGIPWVKLPSVIDNLSSTSAVDALSAKQGKALASRLDEFSTDTGRPKEYTGNIDNINVTSFYYVRNASGTFPSGVSKYGYLQTYKSWYDNTERKQRYMPYDSDAIYTRTCNNQGTWSAWVKILTDNQEQTDNNSSQIWTKYITGGIYIVTAIRPYGTSCAYMLVRYNNYNTISWIKMAGDSSSNITAVMEGSSVKFTLTAPSFKDYKLSIIRIGDAT